MMGEWLSFSLNININNKAIHPSGPAHSQARSICQVHLGMNKDEGTSCKPCHISCHVTSDISLDMSSDISSDVSYQYCYSYGTNGGTAMHVHVWCMCGQGGGVSGDAQTTV